MSIAEITEVLLKSGSKGLPQPVEYVLQQTGDRFGQLRVLSRKEGTIVEATDTILLTQISNEHSLRGLMLQPIANGQLGSKLCEWTLFTSTFEMPDIRQLCLMTEETFNRPECPVSATPEIPREDEIASRVASLISGEKNQNGW